MYKGTFGSCWYLSVDEVAIPAVAGHHSCEAIRMRQHQTNSHLIHPAQC